MAVVGTAARPWPSARVNGRRRPHGAGGGVGGARDFFDVFLDARRRRRTEKSARLGRRRRDLKIMRRAPDRRKWRAGQGQGVL